MITEVNEVGLSLVTGHPCEVGEELELAWRMSADERPLKVSCVVRDCSANRTGVEFINLPFEDRLRLKNSLTQLTKAPRRHVGEEDAMQ